MPRLRLPSRRLLAGLALAGLTLTAAGVGGWHLFRADAGEPSTALGDAWHHAHRFVARDGRLLRERPSEIGLRGRERPLEEFGARMVAATLVGEDRAFFEHDGVDRLAILRAIGQAVHHQRPVSGASTITQQLVKLLDARGEPGPRTVGGKLREAARAQNLEEVLAKPEILAAYINRLPYGHGLVGADAAARAYFGVAPRDLSWAQSAFLAVLPRAPSYLDPYTHQDRVRLRQAALLRALHDQGHLGPEDLARALAEPIVLRPLERPFLAPHLVEALLAQGDLGPGQETRTTLDLDLQRDLEGLVRTHVAALADKGATDAAVLVVDNGSGEILAYVGSADFHDPAISGQVDMIRARRQPGSTLKPFVYALAFARGHTAAEPTPDVATRFQEKGGTYTPVNFGRGYEGPIPLREALAGSLNIPAIRLAAELDDGELLRHLHDLGLESLDQPAAHYGLALALGSGEVRLRELAGAYVALARGGDWVPLRARVDDPAELGRDMPEGTGRRVLDPGVAAQVSEVLADPLARVRGLHGRGPFTLPYPVAVKTGTSSGYRDTWAVGYTRERTVAVWLGNADGSATAELTGASGAGPLFAAAMRRAMGDVPGRAPLWEPELLASADVCPLSGLRPGPACEESATRLFIAGHLPEGTCDMHAHVRPDPRAADGFRCDESSARRAVLLPDLYGDWLLAHGPRDELVPWLLASATPGCRERSAEIPTLRIAAPLDGAVFLRDARGGATVEVRVETDARALGRDLGDLEIVVDGHVVARAAWPYRALIAATPGDHEVLARPLDPAIPVHLAPARYAVR